MSCSGVWVDVAAGGGAGAAVRTLGSWVEIRGRDVDGDTTDSLVVSSERVETLVVVAGTTVVAVVVVGVGAGTGGVMVVPRETAEVVSVCSVVLAVVTTSSDVVMTVDGAPVVVAVGVAVGDLRVVDVIGPVAAVTLAVTGLMVDL